MTAACSASRRPPPDPEAVLRPNVLLVLVEELAHGDLSARGNPRADTPRLDALLAGSASIEPFYASATAAPSQAALLTGRWPYRAGIVERTSGQPRMRPDEQTLAEQLGAAGWSTGWFGRWSLGDVHPTRPVDQGFGHVVPLDTDAGDPSGAAFGSDGVPLVTGDAPAALTDEALAFVRAEALAGRPFLAVLACPVPTADLSDDELEPYRRRLATPSGPQAALPEGADPEAVVRRHAALGRVDRELGRLLDGLAELAIDGETIVVVVGGHGPREPRWNGGLVGGQGEVREGGVRVPCLWSWPGTVPAGPRTGDPVAHVDLLPSLLEACGVPPSEGATFDGVSQWARLLDPGRAVVTPDLRPVVLQAHRGDWPVHGHNAMLRTRRWKLVHASGHAALDGPAPWMEPDGSVDASAVADGERTDPDQPRPGVAIASRESALETRGAPGEDASGEGDGAGTPAALRSRVPWQLFDMHTDPLEQRDVAADHPGVVAALSARYDAWFADVTAAGFDPIPLSVGHPDQGVVQLTRAEWIRTSVDAWGGRATGQWILEVLDPGPYDVLLPIPPGLDAQRAELTWRDQRWVAQVPEGVTRRVFKALVLEPGEGVLEALFIDRKGRYSPHEVVLTPRF